MSERAFYQLLIVVLILGLLGVTGLLLWKSGNGQPPVSFNLQPKVKP